MRPEEISLILIVVLAIGFVCYTFYVYERDFNRSVKAFKEDLDKITEERAMPTADDKYRKYSVEYLPLSQRYYPKHGDQFIYRDLDGVFTLSNYRAYCDRFRSEQDCLAYYNKFLEFQGVGIQVIKYDRNSLYDGTDPWAKSPKGMCDCDGRLRQCDCVGPS